MNEYFMQKKTQTMDKKELNKTLEFIKSPEGDLQILFYAKIENIEEPLKLNIKEEDLSELQKLFIKSINTTIVEKDDYAVLPLSTADERGKCFYNYDLELPEELKVIQNVIGNDNLKNFDFNTNQISNIISIIIVIADSKNEIALYKNLSPVEIIGRGGYLLWKSKQMFERFNDQLLRISSKFHIISVAKQLIIVDLNALEKSLGFHDVIIKEATASLKVINNMEIVSNLNSLEDLITNVSFARKLIKVAKSSPVIKLKIPNTRIIEFAKSHPLTKNKMRFNANGKQFDLDTQISKNLFIKILNDDLLTSELTKLHYDSLAKDDIENEVESEPKTQSNED